MTRKNAALLALVASLLTGTAAHAQYNTSQFLNAGQANALNRGMAKANLYRNGNLASDRSDMFRKEACGDLSLGNVVVPPGRGPREVTTIVKGDIINVNKFSRCK